MRPMPRFKNALLIGTCLLLALPASAGTPLKPQTALAMVGDPLYAPGFSHFAYANPDAPKNGVLKLGTTGSYDSLNPFIVRGTTPFGLGTGTMSLVYESLMTRGWDEPFTLYGLLAESVEVADDRTSIIFNLNKAAHFSDGTPVTADDVLYSFETLRDKGRPNHRFYYKKVAFAEKMSPTRVKFTFAKDAKGVVDREMPLIMGLMPIFPKHDWQDRNFSETSSRAPVGSGPYKVTVVDMGRAITYDRDPHYWAADLPVMKGLYNFSRIHIDYYRDDSISLQAFKAGQYDMRRESNPNQWVSSYNFPAVTDGRVRLEKLEHHRTEPATGFIFNTRRAPFTDPTLRAALEYSFDASWVNKNLYHGQYKRVTSFFPNSELAAPPLPEGKELDILNSMRGQLPAEIFAEPVTPPDANDEEQFRDNLLKAEQMLKDTGYTIDGDQLYTPPTNQKGVGKKPGVPVTFEILLSDPGEEKTALNWSRALKRLGITATVRTVDSAQYQARLAGFDYDVTLNKWTNSLSPGNEQMFFWGSAAADQKGSRNYAGVKDPAVDAVAAMIPQAKTREDLVAAARALDRVLMAGHYTVPLYYLGADDIASWTKLHHPDQLSLYGNVMEAWWREQ
jgi:microcin C transport system substrate-binding protein